MSTNQVSQRHLLRIDERMGIFDAYLEKVVDRQMYGIERTIAASLLAATHDLPDIADDIATTIADKIGEGNHGITASLDHIARDLRNSTAEAIYARVDEALKQRGMATQTAPRRTTKGRCT